MSLDVKFFTACSHVVNGTQFRYDLCPRCYGKGYYIDISFDAGGKAVVTGGPIKMQQEILKVLIDHKGSNPFHLNWGSEVYMLPGHKQTRITKTRIELMVRDAIEHLRRLQKNEALTNKTISDNEIIKDIASMTLKRIGITNWQVDVILTNNLSEIYSQVVTF